MLNGLLRIPRRKGPGIYFIVRKAEVRFARQSFPLFLMSIILPSPFQAKKLDKSCFLAWRIIIFQPRSPGRARLYFIDNQFSMIK